MQGWPEVKAGYSGHCPNASSTLAGLGYGPPLREAHSREVGWELQSRETAMDKQDPAARGANPGASQLSHPAMKQSADFIETRSPAPSRSRCFSRFITSSGPRELPGAARGEGEDDRKDAGWPNSRTAALPPLTTHTHMFQKKVGRGIAKIWRGWLRAHTAPVKPCPPHCYPVACPSPCGIPVGPFLSYLSSCLICREQGWHLLSLLVQ